MRDKAKTKAQLIEELATLRARQAAPGGAQTLNEHAFRRIFDAIPDPAMLWERQPDGRITMAMVNAAACAETGGKIGDFLNSTADAFFEHAPEVAEVIRRAFETGETQRVEMPYRLRTIGEEKWGLADFVRIDDRRVFNVIRDITDRKRADEALCKREEQYRQAVENSPNAIFSVDSAGVIQTWNQACEHLFQYGQEMIGQPYHPLLRNPEGRSAIDAHVARVFQGQTCSDLEITYQCRDGTERFTISRLYPVFDATGQVQVCVFANTDITERRRTEETLRKSEVLLRSLTESSEDMMILHDLEGQIVYYNGPRRYGLEPADAVGKTPFDLFDHDTAVRMVEQIKGVAAIGQSQTFEQRIIWKGEPLTFLVHTYPITDEAGNITGVARVHHNITERKQIEEALQRRSHDLNVLIQAGQALTSTLDLEQVLARLIQQAVEAVEAAGGSVWMWDEARAGWLVCRAAHHEGVAESLINLSLPPGKGIVGWAAQHRESVLVADAQSDPRFAAHIDAQTGYRTVSLIAVPIQRGETVLGVLEAVNGDFDEDDLAVIQTLAATAAIAIENARLVERERQHNRELEASNAELDAYAHTVAHDLKNPLGIVLGHSMLMEELCETAQSDPSFYETLRTSMQAIARHSARMSNIIDELLLLASLRKIEELELLPLDMSSIVSEALDRLDYLIKQHQAEIIAPDGASWPVAMGHAPWVEEVWTNYISNAVKYGGSPAAPPRVTLGYAREPDGMVRFWVRDNGPGLTPEEQARLFSVFTQLDRARAKGHGLGLSIVRRIIEKLGGRVEVESEVGKGSTFSFILPAYAEAR